MIASYKNEKMLALATEKLRQAKWDPERRHLFAEISRGDADLIDALEVTQMQDEYESKYLTLGQILIPLVGKEAKFRPRIRRTKVPHFLKSVFKRYDEKNSGNGQIYLSLLEEF